MIIADVTNQIENLAIAFVNSEKYEPLGVFTFPECGVLHRLSVLVKERRSSFFRFSVKGVFDIVN
jgi:hypothetical protein